MIWILKNFRVKFYGEWRFEPLKTNPQEIPFVDFRIVPNLETAEDIAKEIEEWGGIRERELWFFWNNCDLSIDLKTFECTGAGG